MGFEKILSTDLVAAQTSSDKHVLTLQLNARDHGAQAGSLASFFFAVVALASSLVLPALLPLAKKIASTREPKLRGTWKNDGAWLARIWTFSHVLFGLLMLLLVGGWASYIWGAVTGHNN